MAGRATALDLSDQPRAAAIADFVSSTNRHRGICLPTREVLQRWRESTGCLDELYDEGRESGE